jgi:hypothetical protein
MPLSDAHSRLAAQGMALSVEVLRAHVEFLDAITMAGR